MDTKKILVLSASARKGGNTDLLCDEFIRGAELAGHSVEKLHVAFMQVRGCMGCRICQVNGGQCVQKDDMEEIYAKIKVADVIVYASPVYFYSFNAQMKAVMDRTFAIEKVIRDKTVCLITTGAAPKREYMSLITEHFHRYLSCFNNLTIGGIIVGCGTTEKKDILGSATMQEAFEMGKNIMSSYHNI